MYAGFNGEFRRKPVVSIRGVGASKKETKEDLVKRLKEERAEREVSYFHYTVFIWQGLFTRMGRLLDCP